MTAEQASGTGSAAGPEVSIAMVSFEMERELPRTLLSLSPALQRGCPPGRIEVVLVDNGSRRPPPVEEAIALGLDVRAHHWRQAPPSPVAALNFAIGQARAPLVCAWIDGARLASPGLIAASLAAARCHPRPIVITANRHFGPGPQYLTLSEGYDQGWEDRLLASVGWPGEGADLFSISSLEAWRPESEDAMIECNALFLPRPLWNELGGYDPRFSSPGGGACNPDVFLRACDLPETQLIRVKGEATFHQVHGGVSSNAADRAIHMVKAISREYYRIRGRPLRREKRPVWLFDPSSGTVEKP